MSRVAEEAKHVKTKPTVLAALAVLTHSTTTAEPEGGDDGEVSPTGLQR